MIEKSILEKDIYGTWRSGERISYRLEETNKLIIRAEVNDRSVSFSVTVHSPESEAKKKFPGGSPFIICMHPIVPVEFATKQGYTLIFMDSYQIAGDDCKHQGCFYELYPYGEKPEEQTGVLMAWAWGASKILDAVYEGLDRELGLDRQAAMVTGVSRWGKATAVCGVFDERFRMTIPTCSGAGGLALFSYTSEGKTYDFTSIGGPKEYTYGQNEPLGCLQSEAERGWFCDRFLTYQSPQELPLDQEVLPVLAVNDDRYYFVVAACMGEDWVNAPSMWECYKKADRICTEKGLGDHLVCHFHKEGHAVLEEDLERIIAYFNHMYYGMDTGVDIKALKTSVFAKASVLS